MKKRIKKDCLKPARGKAFFKLLALALLAQLSCFPSHGENKKVIENIDYLYMHVGLQMDYPLPEGLKKEQLKFEGNYKKYTSAVYRKKSHDIRFAPKRKGSAVLIIKNRKNKIIGSLHLDIQKDNLHKIAAELRDLLIAVDGIEVKIYNKKVFIDGQVLLPREMARINNVITQYNSPLVQSLVTYSPEAQKKVAELLEKEIDYPEVSVRYAYNRFLLEGCVSNPDEEKRALSLANLYTQFDTSAVGDKAKKRNIYIVKNDLKVPCESVKKAQDEEKQKTRKKQKLIQIVVHFVEMTKSFQKGFLFQWTPAIGDQGTQVTGSLGTPGGPPSGISAVLTATVANFFPKLNWAKTFDFARVLHNSSILVEEGGPGGRIFTNVTVPQQEEGGVKISGGVTNQVSTHIKNAKIKGERENMVWMSVDIAVTSGNRAAQTNRQVSTNLSVRDGSSAVIGGIISSSLSRDYNKSPLGSPELPIIDLISSKQYDTQKTQFVVFITPAIRSSASAGVERIKQKFKLNE